MKKPSHTFRAHRLIRQLTALAVVQVALILLVSDRVEATVFPCASGDVACLVAAINSANLTAGLHTVQLGGSTFTLNVVDSSLDGPNGLPSVATNLTIEGEGSIIERNAASAARFRIFHVQATGNLTLNRVTVRNGWLLPAALAGLQCAGLGARDGRGTGGARARRALCRSMRTVFPASSRSSRTRRGP